MPKKPKKQENELFLVAIVAIVAIVALIILTLADGKTTYSAVEAVGEEGNLVGQGMSAENVRCYCPSGYSSPSCASECGGECFKSSSNQDSDAPATRSCIVDRASYTAPSGSHG